MVLGTSQNSMQILLFPPFPPFPPFRCFSSSTYVVDITKLAHPDDIKSDNFGVWSHSGSHPLVFKVHVEDDYVHVEKGAPGATGNDVVYLRQLHSVHPSHKDFKRMIAFLSGELLLRY